MKWKPFIYLWLLWMSSQTCVLACYDRNPLPLGNPFLGLFYWGHNDFFPAGGAEITDAISREMTVSHSPSIPGVYLPVIDAVSREMTLSHTPSVPGAYLPAADAISREMSYLNPCPDLNQDGIVDDNDLLRVLLNFGQQGEGILEDLNFDGVVDDVDILITLFLFGQPCVP
ncbi:MAG: hypothetical protein KIT45_05655 [Fimbriimonadia bacterium]|nr:hypothetical protein [Fimbriimonadia bacterium]